MTAKSPKAAALSALAGAVLATFEPVLVHAYRRTAHMVDGKEAAVEVEAVGETVKFSTNAEGHVVGLVTTEALFKHLTTKIPEAYIRYEGGVNIPAKKSEDKAAPLGQFVLTNGETTVILDGMDDDAVRDFAEEAGLTQEELPAAVTGEVLKQLVYNKLHTGD